jgi:hypothetical protein
LHSIKELRFGQRWFSIPAALVAAGCSEATSAAGSVTTARSRGSPHWNRETFRSSANGSARWMEWSTPPLRRRSAAICFRKTMPRVPSRGKGTCCLRPIPGHFKPHSIRRRDSLQAQVQRAQAKAQLTQAQAQLDQPVAVARGLPRSRQVSNRLTFQRLLLIRAPHFTKFIDSVKWRAVCL